MAFAITETLEGFEWSYNLTGSPPKFMRLPAVAAEVFTKGEPVVLSAGRVTAAAASGADIVGISQESKTIPAVTDNDADHLLLVLLVKPGDVFRVNLETPMEDFTVSSLTANVVAAGTGMTVATHDDDCNGSPMIVYDGPGKGQWRIIYDFDATGYGGGALYEQACLIDRPFSPAITTASKVMILGAHTAPGGAPGQLIDFGGVSIKNVNGADAAGSMRVVSIDNLGEKGWMEVSFIDTLWNAP